DRRHRTRRAEDLEDHVLGVEPRDVVDVAGYSEVGQEDSLLTLIIEMGHHDVGWFDVTVDQPSVMGGISEKGPLTRIRAPQCTHSRHRNGKRAAQPTGQVPGQRPSTHMHPAGSVAVLVNLDTTP